MAETSETRQAEDLAGGAGKGTVTVVRGRDILGMGGVVDVEVA